MLGRVAVRRCGVGQILRTPDQPSPVVTKGADMSRGLLTRSAVRKQSRAASQEATARYDSAMYAVSIMGDQLIAARASGATVAERHGLHVRIDEELARAIDACRALYQRLLAAAGGMHHGDTDPEVQRWKRRLNTALTVRSAHQLAEFDDAGVISPSVVRPTSRAAFGPHQAGLDFDLDSHA